MDFNCKDDEILLKACFIILYALFFILPHAIINIVNTLWLILEYSLFRGLTYLVILCRKKYLFSSSFCFVVCLKELFTSLPTPPTTTTTKKKKKPLSRALSSVSTLFYTCMHACFRSFFCFFNHHMINPLILETATARMFYLNFFLYPMIYLKVDNN